MGIRLERENLKIVVMAILLAICCFLTYYFHWVLEIATVFTHFFYIPIILASIWWKRRGLVVAIFLAALLILSHFFVRGDVLTINDYLRVVMFIVIAFVVVALGEHIAKAEVKTKLAYRELNQIFNVAADGMCVIDKDFNVLRINEAFSTLCGVSMDEAEGRKCYEVLKDPLCNTDDCLLTRILSGEDRIEYETQKELLDGIRIPCIMTATPYRRPDGELAGVVELVKDITKRKRDEEALRRSESRLRLLSQRAIRAQEEERARIARELHDQLAQELVVVRREALSLTESLKETAAYNRLTDLVGLVDKLLDIVHNMSVELRPKMLDELGLTKAVQWYTEDFEHRTGISCLLNTHYGTIQEGAIRKEVATAAYRILQEAMVNALRHSKADKVAIDISIRKGRLIIAITDNGIGIDTGRLKDSSSLGLLGMMERASIVGGSLRIRGNPGRGTRVTMSLPLQRA